MILAELAWPLAFGALGASMVAICNYRRSRIRGFAVAALNRAHASMLAIEGGWDAMKPGASDSGPFAEQVSTISSIGQHLAARTRHLSAIIEAQPECVKLVDAEGRLLQMNPAGLRMIAAGSMSEVRGVPIEKLIVEEHREAYREMHKRVIEGHAGSLTFEVVGLDGRHLWLETSAVPLADRKGQTVHLAVTRDVTERLRQEEAVREAQASSETANRSKSLFLANMSHELRTPLTAIIGYSELLTGEAACKEGHHAALEAINSSAGHLLALINDVLDVSKIESGHVELEHLSFNLRELVQQTVQSLRHGAMEAGLTLKVTWGESLPEVIESDPTRIRQVLTNLISNAIKFGNQGSVEIRLSAGPQSPSGEPRSLVFSVIDTGIGIAESSLERIFSPFAQAEASINRTFGGTGLGLSISREIARRMGGDLTVESEVGQGSTFTLSLPVLCKEASVQASAEVSAGAPSRAAGPAAFRGRVLVVEDNEINRRLLNELLRRRGLDVTSAPNGAAGLECATDAVEANQTFDLVLLDMHMPVQDGFVTVKKLREQGYSRPVVALTASAMPGDRRRCIDAGCDEHLAKPINNALLDEVLSTYLEMPSDRLATDRTR